MKFISCDEHRLMPWKNGKGTTREILVHPPGASTDSKDFCWRISIADIPADGPFSVFPAIARSLLLLEGNGMTLTIDDKEHPLEKPFDGIDFAGNSRTECRLRDGPTRDVNIMTQRDRFSHTWSLHETFPATITNAATETVLVCLKGTAEVEEGKEALTLSTLDSVIVGQPAVVRADPGTVILEIGFFARTQ